MYTVYILKCSDNSYYVGCSNDFNDCLSRHQNGQVSYTAKRLPIVIVHQSIFLDKCKAFEFEIYNALFAERDWLPKWSVL